MHAKTLSIVRIAFAIPWIVFGIQHFIYADFVKGLVPAYIPLHIFWVYFTACAMIAAGVSFIIGRQVQLAAFLLGCMLLGFILLLHTVILSGDPQGGIHWTRVMQDTALMASAFALAIISGRERPGGGTSAGVADGEFTGGGLSGEARPDGAAGAAVPGWRKFLASPGAVVFVRYCYALPLIVLGAQHFAHNAFVTAKVPAYFPLINFLDYVVGIVLIAAAYGILFTSNIKRTTGSLSKGQTLDVSGERGTFSKGPVSRISFAWVASTLGIILTVLALLQHIPMLVSNDHAGINWTGAMLDFALAAGAFILSACTLPLQRFDEQASASMLPA